MNVSPDSFSGDGDPDPQTAAALASAQLGDDEGRAGDDHDAVGLGVPARARERIDRIGHGAAPAAHLLGDRRQLLRPRRGAPRRLEGREHERPVQRQKRPNHFGGVLRLADRHDEGEAPLGKRLCERVRQPRRLVGVVRDVE
ncbi:MAG TPA: hypothetical protein VK665_11005, partial [Candidatus Elarobacter sp.]|nr:hypothetical protein [Candidatus Elarobacter sp.]